MSSTYVMFADLPHIRLTSIEGCSWELQSVCARLVLLCSAVQSVPQ